MPFFSFLMGMSKLILLIGTKLHRVVVKLAVEIMNLFPWLGNRQFNLRDELFWFGKPRLLLWLIQFISFQVTEAKTLYKICVTASKSHILTITVAERF